MIPRFRSHLDHCSCAKDVRRDRGRGPCSAVRPKGPSRAARSARGSGETEFCFCWVPPVCSLCLPFPQQQYLPWAWSMVGLLSLPLQRLSGLSVECYHRSEKGIVIPQPLPPHRRALGADGLLTKSAAAKKSGRPLRRCRGLPRRGRRRASGDRCLLVWPGVVHLARTRPPV